MKKATPLALATATVVSALFALSSPNLNAATLIAQWDMNEGSGTTITSQFPTGPGVASEDFSKGQTVGTTPITWGDSGVGAAGSTNYLHFDGTTDGNTLDTNVSGAALAGTGAKTFVAWIKSTKVTTEFSTTGQHQQAILSFSPSAGTVAGGDLRLLLENNGTLRGEVSAGFFANNTVDLRDGEWHMVAAIFDTNTSSSSFYLDGSILTPTSKDKNGSPVTTDGRTINTKTDLVGTSYPNINFVIGGMHPKDHIHGFDGGIDMVKVYDGALTLSELNALYTVIPEPASAALIFAGLFMTFAVLRRKGRQSV